MKEYTNECLYKDVYTIIEMMNPDLRNKINKEFINFLKENQDIEFEGTIDKNIPIKNQELREEIKLMLSILYINYFCPQEKKKEILEAERKNINKYYDVFKNKDNTKLPESKIEEQVDKESQNNMQLIKYKENFLTKIMKKIKNIINTINNERKK